MLPSVISPMSKIKALPLVSKRILVGVKSDLIRVAVPYLLAELLEIMLKLEEIVLQEENDSSIILISWRCKISRFSLIIKDSICNC